MKRLLILMSIALIACLTATAAQFDYSQLAPHPRLLLPAGGEAAITASINNYPPLATVHERILAFADASLTAAPVERIKEGKRLLAVSREALKRIYYLAYTYRMTGDDRYAKRAEQEMQQVCGFTDWNPTHFLDVGEMVMALAIGYDWLFDQISPETKSMVVAAVKEKGFDAAEDTKNAWFYGSKNNWNSVCNGGLTFGALALYEAMPEAAEAIIEKCMQTNPKAMSGYGPDGGYPEGYMYWGYGTSFQVLLIAALESALGTDNGLSSAPGFMESPRFIEYMNTPTGGSFNYSDAPLHADCMPMMFWFAGKLNDLSLLTVEREYLNKPNVAFAEDRLLPSLMVFCSKLDLNKVTAPANRYWYNRGDTPTFIYRSGWNDSTDTYLGVKGGSPSTSHAHMDAGSFVYEKDGYRWATDLGMQSYITLESKGVDLWNMGQNSQRWEVFRIGCTTHNTLVVNNERHDVKSSAPITQTFRSKRKKGAEVDLTSTLARCGVKKAVRTVALDKKDNLSVTDKVATADSAAQIMWVMVTPAQARIAGPNIIELTQEGHTMRLKAQAPSGVEMKIWSNEPPHDYDFKNPGTCRVGFVTTLPANSESTLRVDLTSMN